MIGRKVRYDDKRQMFLFPKFVYEYGTDMPSSEAQKELNHYWEREKSNPENGALYERYIGYLYEEAGYHVEYTGIQKGVKDAGRDLVCRYGNRVLIIQCKNWAYDKKIYSKYIYQLHGTVDHYRCRYKNRRVSGVFFTTSRLSFDALIASRNLEIETHDSFLMWSFFPVVKCKCFEKKYYLPDDWHYNDVNMDLKAGDMYCMTVAEAESKGFARGMRW